MQCAHSQQLLCACKVPLGALLQQAAPLATTEEAPSSQHKQQQWQANCPPGNRKLELQHQDAAPQLLLRCLCHHQGVRLRSHLTGQGADLLGGGGREGGGGKNQQAWGCALGSLSGQVLCMCRRRAGREDMQGCVRTHAKKLMPSTHKLHHAHLLSQLGAHVAALVRGIPQLLQLRLQHGDLRNSLSNQRRCMVRANQSKNNPCYSKPVNAACSHGGNLRAHALQQPHAYLCLQRIALHLQLHLSLSSLRPQGLQLRLHL